MNWPAYIARLQGVASWPWVEPPDIRCPTLIYTGSRDGNVVVQLQRQRQAIEAAGLQLAVFAELTHSQLFTERTVIAPAVLGFLNSPKNTCS
jgi:pimeloyl-ACP methyl ester carboxylesterase